MHHVNKLIIILALLLGFSASSINAQPVNKNKFFDNKAQGWFWYQDPEEQLDELEEKKFYQPTDAFGFSTSQTDPLKQLEELQETVKYAQAQALMNPTDMNAVANYMRVQKGVTDRADVFSTTWQRALLFNPDLDATLNYPVALQARKAYEDESIYQQKNFLLAAAQEWGIWFFYRSDCPYCQRFAPVLDSFAKTYGFEVLAISQDGGAISHFPDFELDAGHSAMLGLSVVPAVFLINPNTNEIHPVANGYVSGQDLADNIYFSLGGEKISAVNRLAKQ